MGEAVEHAVLLPVDTGVVLSGGVAAVALKGEAETVSP